MSPLMKITSILLALLAAVLVSQNPLKSWLDKYIIPSGSTHGSIINDEITNYIEHLIGLSNVTGLALTVVRPDGEVEFSSWGNRTEDGEKVTPETLFAIGSCSKAFLSASVGILLNDFAIGRNVTPLPTGLEEIKWQTKVKNLLPSDWKLQNAVANGNADLMDILSHVSGLPRHDLSCGPSDTTLSVIRKMRYLRPAYELREKFSYNNQMYMTGSHIVSTYGGNLADFVKNRIFLPLGMNYSTMSPTEAYQTENLSQAWSNEMRRIPFWFTEEMAEVVAGAGAVISNAVDMSKWLKLLLNSGVNPFTDEILIPRTAFEAAVTSRVIAEGQGMNTDISIIGYGMGWLRNSYRGHEIIWHNGGLPGFSSIVAFLPSSRLGIAALINTSDRDDFNFAIIFRIIEEALNLPHATTSTDSSHQTNIHTARRETIKHTLPLSTYAGTYENAGYGQVVLCDPAATSSYCKDVLSTFATVDSASESSSKIGKETSQLYAAWPRIFSTHLRLIHDYRNVFNITLTSLFPEGYGENKSPFETGQSPAQVEFLVHNDEVLGVGLFGSFPRDSTLLKPSSDMSLADRAEVWFRKVNDEK